MNNFEETQVELKLHERLILLLIAVIEIIGDLFEDTNTDKLFVKIINDENVFEQIKLLIAPCKNNFKEAT